MNKHVQLPIMKSRVLKQKITDMTILRCFTTKMTYQKSTLKTSFMIGFEFFNLKLKFLRN